MSGCKPVIAVAGAGRMGTGIAQVFACAGHRVKLIDLKKRSGDEEQFVLHNALEQIEENLKFLSSLHVFEEKLVEQILNRISCHDITSAAEALPEAGIVFEAVPEVLEIKKTALTFISSLVGSETLIASTTSTFLVETLSSYVKGPERFMNTHWLNPAYLIPLVEVSPGENTSPVAIQDMFTLLESAGKVPVRCAPTPGFIVPRIQALAMNEAARLVEEGVASPEEIDRATRVGFGLRFAILGLIEFIDWGGGDILYYASNYLKDSLRDNKFAPPSIISENMEKGKTGLKAGQGFYDFTDRDVSAYRRETIAKFVDLLKHLGFLAYPQEE